MTPEAAQSGLQRALKGHDYAWTFAHDGAAAQIGVVMAAASSERDDKGRLERVYGNDRSINGLHDRLETALGWPNAFSEPRWDHGVEGATTALARLTRGAEIEAFTPDGRTLREETNRIWEARLGVAGRSAPDSLNPSLEIAKSWAPNMRSRSPRDFAHVILSAKPGTDKQAFMDAARVTLAKEFAGHEYVFVMHTNRDHIHVHAAVRLTRSDGERLDPKIQHFARWRETLEGLSSPWPAEDDDSHRRGVHPAISHSCPTLQFSADPLLRFPRQSLPCGEAGAVSSAPCHGGTPARRRQRGEGLSGPIRRADRRFALPMPSLQSRTHDAVSHASADHQCTTLCRYVMNAAHADPRRTDLSRLPRARIGTAIALGLAGTAGPAKEPRCFKAIPFVVAMEGHSWPHPRGRFSRIFPRRDARFTAFRRVASIRSP